MGIEKKAKHYIRYSGDLRGIVLGSMDGIISTLGVIAAVTGATYNNFVVLVAGLAAAVAEAISMFFSSYISSKSQREVFESEMEKEKYEMKNMPKGERKEIYDIYRAKGFKGKILDAIVKRITSNKRLWLKTMLVEELKIIPESFNSPLRDAGFVFLGDIVGGFIPLLAFLIPYTSYPLVFSVLISIVALFVIGSLKSIITKKSFVTSGIESVLVGMAAAGLGYAIGYLISILL